MRRKNSYKKENIIARIRYHNKKLEKENRVQTKGLNYTDLKAVERTVRAKIEGQKAGFDVSNIETLSVKESEELKRLSRGKRFDSSELLLQQSNKMVKQYKGEIDEFKKKMSQLKGFDFAKNLKYAFYEKSVRTPKKILERDIQVLSQVVFNKNFFNEVLIQTAKEVNQFLKDNKMKQIKFDFTDEKTLIEQLNSVEKTTKTQSRIGTPKDFADSDEPDIIDYDLED